jgi:hypothetical protein
MIINNNQINYFNNDVLINNSLTAASLSAAGGDSYKWNSAYNYATTYPVVTSVYYAPYNLLGATNTNLSLFTVPVGRRFICTSFGGYIIEFTPNSPAGTCTIRLVNTSRNNNTISNNYQPTLASLSILDNAVVVGNTNNITVSGGETVALRINAAASGFTVLSAGMFVTGVLI